MSPAHILEGLHQMSVELAWLGLIWHAVVLVVASAVVARWRPQLRLDVLLLAALALSVSAVSFAYGNPFNGNSFAILAVTLSAFVAAIPEKRSTPGPRWAKGLGLALLVYGWCYPAFATDPWYAVLYASPVGVVPCPTLAIIGAFTLLGDGFGSRAVPALLAFWSAFYAVFGIFQLGVEADVGLAAGALGLIALTVRNVREHSHHAPGHAPVPAH